MSFISTSLVSRKSFAQKLIRGLIVCELVRSYTDRAAHYETRLNFSLDSRAFAIMSYNCCRTNGLLKIEYFKEKFPTPEKSSPIPAAPMSMVAAITYAKRASLIIIGSDSLRRSIA
jgi:hypothetical protein